MAKVKRVVKLVGVVESLSGVVPAKTSDAKDVIEFRGASPKGVQDYFKFGLYRGTNGDIEAVTLTTPKGCYDLTFVVARGIWVNKAIGIDVTLKKIVGELRYRS